MSARGSAGDPQPSRSSGGSGSPRDSYLLAVVGPKGTLDPASPGAGFEPQTDTSKCITLNACPDARPGSVPDGRSPHRPPRSPGRLLRNGGKASSPLRMRRCQPVVVQILAVPSSPPSGDWRLEKRCDAAEPRFCALTYEGDPALYLLKLQRHCGFSRQVPALHSSDAGDAFISGFR
jgi:hypothetical protein